jgi:superfamily II DNA or RNA helicase
MSKLTKYFESQAKEIVELDVESDSDVQPDVELDDLSVTLRSLGYRSFRPHQRDAAEAAVQNKDLILRLATGAGKTLTYLVRCRKTNAARGHSNIATAACVPLEGRHNCRDHPDTRPLTTTCLLHDLA